MDDDKLVWLQNEPLRPQDEETGQLTFETHMLNKTMDGLITVYPGIAPERTLKEYIDGYGDVGFYGLYVAESDQDKMFEPFMFLHFTHDSAANADYKVLQEICTEWLDDIKEIN